jgi:mRNA interferase YafQ
VRAAISGSSFKKDVGRMEKRGKQMAKLRQATLMLIEGNPLPARFKDHPLTGNWEHFRDSHIEPDWVLIYKIDGNKLHLVRTGTHSDLFD